MADENLTPDDYATQQANLMKEPKIKLDAYEQGIEDMADSLVPASPKTRAKFDAMVEKARKNANILTAAPFPKRIPPPR
jgi:hypothetical protein